ncbi:MAG: hypothetical protein E4H21_11350 [Thermodesulfobacteriales bacterium]|nr:MAG: hypothetical protein E4H21_11350 [Thermodesulfobacteriales bacterium]
MSNKKILYASTLLAIIIIVGGIAIFVSGKNTEPITIHSEGLWDVNVLNTTNLVKGSDVIVIGEVKEILPSRWTTTDGKRPVKIDDERIYTDFIIRVDEYLKNPQSTKEITVRTLGGKVDDDSMIVEDEAEFKPNEKVLLFLTTEDPFTKNIGSEHLRVTGWVHGKFTIINDQAIRPKLPQEHRNIPLQELIKSVNESK